MELPPGKPQHQTIPLLLPVSQPRELNSDQSKLTRTDSAMPHGALTRHGSPLSSTRLPLSPPRVIRRQTPIQSRKYTGDLALQGPFELKTEPCSGIKKDFRWTSQL